MVAGGYGAVGVQVGPISQRRRAAIGSIALVAVAILVLAAIVSSTGSPTQPHALLEAKPREDIDPGSLRGLEEAAGGGSMGMLGHGRSATLAQETEAGELEQLQEKETTQSDRKASDERTPALRQSLGRTIAKYFTTVRSIKDDQGTFLG